ncbi:SRPBCC family protein [Nocardia sp. ET3-3]|uniref:SRPBCC family protein n=1 Tax=Nocardia terrae TaxID=2675851 RepID=A0A7K1US54_9NOCA|nr:SRPBCC family protein [Nocardia terrae]MVU77182.1 SRPBCC family protein [Nocardia terrae]
MLATTTVETVLPAPRDVVYKLFRERDGLDSVLPVRVSLVRPGADSPSGVGARYHLGLAGLGPTEETIELVPGRKMVYQVVAGLPVRRHVGTITFADAPSGTQVVYRIESEPRLRVPGPVLKLVLDRLITTMFDGARKALANTPVAEQH